jgi:hypothetical protein
VWGIFDAGVMGGVQPTSLRTMPKQQAADLSVTFNQYGQRNEADRVQVDPPIEVESATWTPAGKPDWWVKERREWFGRVRNPDGRQKWVKAADPRPAKEGTTS